MKDPFEALSVTVHFRKAEDLTLNTGCVLHLSKETKRIELYPFGVDGRELAEMFVALVDMDRYIDD